MDEVGVGDCPAESTPTLAGMILCRRSRCAETMRSWRTYSTLGWAARRRRMASSSCDVDWAGRVRGKLGCGFDGGDAEVFVAPGETGSGGGDAGFGVAGDGGVAIEDEEAMGRDAGGVDLGGVQLGVGETGKEEGEEDDATDNAPSGLACGKNSEGRRRKSQVVWGGHGFTSRLR